MSTELATVGGVSYAIVNRYRDDYVLTVAGGREVRLKRGEDFGKPTAKLPKPILYKAGAEKIIWEYGLVDRYELMESIEDYENGFFFYRFKCSLVALNNDTGELVVVKEGFGSANTRESNIGTQTAFDAANTKLKIAEKRAMVDAVIKLARLSGLFTQDLENDDFMKGAVELVQSKDSDLITAKQRQRLFAIGADKGFSTEQVKVKLKVWGVESMKNITQKQYDELCERFEKGE